MLSLSQKLDRLARIRYTIELCMLNDDVAYAIYIGASLQGYAMTQVQADRSALKAQLRMYTAMVQRARRTGRRRCKA